MLRSRNMFHVVRTNSVLVGLKLFDSDERHARLADFLSYGRSHHIAISSITCEHDIKYHLLDTVAVI